MSILIGSLPPVIEIGTITLEGFDTTTETWQHLTTVLLPDTVSTVRVATLQRRVVSPPARTVALTWAHGVATNKAEEVFRAIREAQGDAPTHEAAVEGGQRG